MNDIYITLYQQFEEKINNFSNFVGDKLFDCDFSPIFTQLSIKTPCSYIEWLADAEQRISKGEDPYNVLSYYDEILESYETWIEEYDEILNSK